MSQTNVLNRILDMTVGAASQKAVELAKIKGSTYYIRMVKFLREIMLNCIGMSACLIIVGCSIVIFHVMVLLYAPFSVLARVWFTSIALGVYVLFTLILFARLCSERKWLEVFKGDQILYEIFKDRLD